MKTKPEQNNSYFTSGVSLLELKLGNLTNEIFDLHNDIADLKSANEVLTSVCTAGYEYP